MTSRIQVVLLLCSAVAFTGAGAAAALRRHHVLEYGEGDGGIVAIATMLTLFGALCAAVVSGFAAVAALLVPVASASYAFTAQRLGLFRIVTGDVAAQCEEETELRA